ncbi:hypothetical protein A2872_02955 [Candidatus Gottesmanbacteria bacterium RIFCSPHIGHO2_01_FULL_42_12]|uniref:Asl1-like glycosyl hydrolase catalytic domain-containing protein n=1 Tax=Candidatus Gottesmanbacteria bacterium RIFCSPHIGHO2_01_FULL_42_12 TaxID=1798377 RepID=A0A1F5Z5I9_9BACT|nr:MAG: hypothetical protein A2872_02955 [Candidatus Gottesmanbacteria bacterium RIFCSPHIGHO2_01_FULL_42_12]
MTLVLMVMFTRPAFAIYDPLSVPNNKFGLHILEPNEIDKAREFVNSTGGEWGYVTIPIRANDRNAEKWLEFMKKSREQKIIPILRIASFPVSSDVNSGSAAHWVAPNDYDLVDFAVFLNELPWPTKNRYVIIYNETNHESEWGGFVYPEEYARILDRAIDIFRQVNRDFFLISAGMDSSQTNIYSYFSVMENTVPGILNKVNGLSFHAYGNPGFTTPPNTYSKVNIASFRFEENYLCRNFSVCNRPIFLTETGWKNAQDWYFENAFGNVWTDQNIVAITPFLLSGGDGPFKEFSFVDENANFKSFAKKIIAFPKIAGRPLITDPPVAKINKFSEIGKLVPGAIPVIEPNIIEKLFNLLRQIFS